MTDLATWQSHKKVRAGEIVRIDSIYDKVGDAPSRFRVHAKSDDESAGVVIKDVPYGVFARLVAETGATIDAIGGVLVFYSDGYCSWSPKDAFLEGYTKLGTEDAGGNYIGLGRGGETQT
jgi:hypothetical protein